jgi:hypothetical protein
MVIYRTQIYMYICRSILYTIRKTCCKMAGGVLGPRTRTSVRAMKSVTWHILQLFYFFSSCTMKSTSLYICCIYVYMYTMYVVCIYVRTRRTHGHYCNCRTVYTMLSSTPNSLKPIGIRYSY